MVSRQAASLVGELSWLYGSQSHPKNTRYNNITIPVQVEERVSEALAADRTASAAATKHSLATQQTTMHAAAAALDAQLRSILTTAAAEAASSTEQWLAAVERRLGHFAAVFQRTQATFTLFSEYATRRHYLSCHTNVCLQESFSSNKYCFLGQTVGSNMERTISTIHTVWYDSQTIPCHAGQ